MKSNSEPFWMTTFRLLLFIAAIAFMWLGITWVLLTKTEFTGIEPNDIGDSFGMVTSLFTGLAAFFAYMAFSAQREQMEEDRNKLDQQIEISAVSNLIQTLVALRDDVRRDIQRAYLTRQLSIPIETLTGCNAASVIDNYSIITDALTQEVSGIEVDMRGLARNADSERAALVSLKKEKLNLLYAHEEALPYWKQYKDLSIQLNTSYRQMLALSKSTKSALKESPSE